MKSLKLIAAILLFSTAAFAGNDNTPEMSKASTTIKGVVIDKVTKEALAGVKIYIGESNDAVYTDLDGNFEISKVKLGTHNISTKLISYKATSIDIECNASTGIIEIELDNK